MDFSIYIFRSFSIFLFINGTEAQLPQALSSNLLLVLVVIRYERFSMENNFKLGFEELQVELHVPYQDSTSLEVYFSPVPGGGLLGTSTSTPPSVLVLPN